MWQKTCQILCVNKIFDLHVFQQYWFITPWSTDGGTGSSAELWAMCLDALSINEVVCCCCHKMTYLKVDPGFHLSIKVSPKRQRNICLEPKKKKISDTPCHEFSLAWVSVIPHRRHTRKLLGPGSGDYVNSVPAHTPPVWSTFVLRS